MIEGGELPCVRGVETIAVVPRCRAVLRLVGSESAEVVRHAVVTRCGRDEDLKPGRVSLEHGPGQERETLKGKLGDRPRFEDADPPDCVADEDGANGMQEVIAEGDVLSQARM